MQNRHEGNPMRCCSDKNPNEAAVCLEQLRLQLQHMRSGDVPIADGVRSPVQQGCVSVGTSGPSAVSPKLLTLREWQLSPRGGCDANGQMVQQLEERLRRHQENGVKRRGELVYAVGKAYSDMEQLQFFVEEVQHDMQGQLEALRHMLAEAKSRIGGMSRRPAEFIEKMSTLISREGHASSACHGEESVRIMSRLTEVRRTLDSIRRELQQQEQVACARQNPATGSGGPGRGGMWDALQAERDHAASHLSEMKEAFVMFLQESLDALEQLKRERMEAETQCIRILS